MAGIHTRDDQHKTVSVQDNGHVAAIQGVSAEPIASPRRSLIGPHGLIGFILPVLIVILWQLASLQGWIRPNLLPAPTTVVGTLVQMVQDGSLVSSLLVSTARWAVGSLIGCSLGLLLGSLVGLFRLAERVLDTSVQMVRTIPFLALAPLLILWLGLDEPPKITLIALASFFPLYLNTFAGIRNVDRKLIEVGKVYQLSQRELLWRVILPAAVPEILTGVRYGLAVAWLALVVAELMGTTQGLGYLLSEGREFVRVDIVIGTIIIFACAGKLVDLLVRALEARLLRWRNTYTGE